MNKEMSLRLRKLFTDSKATLESFGAIADVSPQAASKWLKTGQISKKSLQALANHHKCDLSWLITGQATENHQKHEGDLVSALPPDEQILLTKYRQINSDRKRTIQKTIAAFAQPEINKESG